VILADAANAWKSAVVGVLDEAPGQAALILVDRFAALRAGSFASEGGGLIAPAEATDWLRFLALECPGCGRELPWFDGDQASGWSAITRAWLCSVSRAPQTRVTGPWRACSTRASSARARSGSARSLL
jgi:hypothetical protein